jgi:hypothetical protein
LTVDADRGGGGIEMAIILPLLLACVFAVAHLSLFYLAQQAALSVAQVAVEGQRAWGNQPGAGHDRADRLLAQLPPVLRDPQVRLECDGQPLTGSCDGVRVTAMVTGTAVSIVPGVRHRVSQTASGAVERITELP